MLINSGINDPQYLVQTALATITTVAPRGRKKQQKNSPERAEMLDNRKRGQRRRQSTMSALVIPAWMNRRTGKPHMHARQTARNLRRIK